MRSANALRVDRQIAEDRRKFREIIREWSSEDLRDAIGNYENMVHQLPNAIRFYMVRVRAVHNELKSRSPVSSGQ